MCATCFNDVKYYGTCDEVLKYVDEKKKESVKSFKSFMASKQAKKQVNKEEKKETTKQQKKRSFSDKEYTRVM